MAIEFHASRPRARNEGFVVFTSRRLLFLGKTAAGRPTRDVQVTVERGDIGSVDYKRGIMSTLTVVPTTGDVAVTFTCGLTLRGSSDGMAEALGAR